MDEPVRVLLVAPPEWKDRRALERVLREVASEHPDRQMVLLHAAVPGKTSLGAEVAHKLGYKLEPHYALWNRPCDLSFCLPEHRVPYRGRLRTGTYCPAAGARRDAAMVKAGADLCVAFTPGDPTAEPPGLVVAATRAGIPIRRITRSRNTCTTSSNR